MADVIVTNITSGDVPGHTILRIPYDDGVTDVDTWLSDAVAAWRALPDGPHTLRGLALRYTARPTAAAIDIRDFVGGRSEAAGVRMVLVVPGSELAWTEAAIDARPHHVRTYAMTLAQLADWIADHEWPVPLDPARGGTGVRVGGGRHVPWDLCVTDPTPEPT
jgi:hypothetical protein